MLLWNGSTPAPVFYIHTIVWSSKTGHQGEPSLYAGNPMGSASARTKPMAPEPAASVVTELNPLSEGGQG